MTREQSDAEPVKRPTAAELLGRVLEEDCSDLPKEVKQALLDLTHNPTGRAMKFKETIKRAVK